MTKRCHRTVTINPPSVTSISTKPGARAMMLHVAQAGSAAASDRGQPRSRRITAPGRTRAAYVAAVSFTGMSTPAPGSKQTAALAARLARTTNANGTPRGVVSPACSALAE
jgi:hypothetical protein